MPRQTGVAQMMVRVETALARSARSDEPEARPLYVFTEGDEELGIAPLRDAATIQVDFHSGSDRRVVGPGVRFAKRAVRRCLRWYVSPMMDQQSRFNHSVLDLIERLRMQNESLRTEVEMLRRRLDE
jgi:hypothetical protein